MSDPSLIDTMGPAPLLPNDYTLLKCGLCPVDSQSMIESFKATRLAKAIVLAALGATSLLAESDSGVLVGVVKDPSDSPVLGAKVSIKNQATRNAREVTSDVRGLFYFRLLPPGEYDLKVEAAGFKRYANSQIKVN